MTMIANGAQIAALQKAAEAYLDAAAAIISEMVGPAADEKAREGTIGSAAAGMLAERMTHRFGAFGAWSGVGQGLGMAFAQMTSPLEVRAAQMILEEGVSAGYANTRATLSPSSRVPRQ